MNPSGSFFLDDEMCQGLEIWAHFKETGYLLLEGLQAYGCSFLLTRLKILETEEMAAR